MPCPGPSPRLSRLRQNTGFSALALASRFREQVPRLRGARLRVLARGFPSLPVPEAAQMAAPRGRALVPI